MPCVLKKSNLVEEFLQGIGCRNGIEGEEMNKVVSGLLANIKQEMGSSLQKELRLLKNEIREGIESSTKTAKDKILKKATPLPRHSLY